VTFTDDIDCLIRNLVNFNLIKLSKFCACFKVSKAPIARAGIIDHPWDKSGLEQRMIEVDHPTPE